MFDLIIRNGHLVRESGVERADLAIENEKIVEIAPTISGPAREEIDATNLHVFPGVIDPHVHFNEPGRTDWEGFETGSAALSAGGGTMFFDMPLNSSPPVLDGASFDLKLAAGLKNSRTDFALWGGLTPDNLDKMEELAERGVVGFKAFMCDSGIGDFRRADDWTLERGMIMASKLGLPVAVHAENEEMTAGKSAWWKSTRRHLKVDDWWNVREKLAEEDAIQRAALLAARFECSLHIVHISNDSCVDCAAAWKQRANLSIETCPHYLAITAQQVAELGAIAKCAPPIRLAPHHDELWAKVMDGAVDIVGSDHSPSPPSMKQGDFFAAWGGIAGVQSTLAILLNREPRLPLPRVAELTASNAARRFKIANKAMLASGCDADVAIIDNTKQHTLCREDLLDRHKLSPYVGRTFRGKIVRTILRGHTIFADGKTVGPPIGRFVRPTRTREVR